MGNFCLARLHVVTLAVEISQHANIVSWVMVLGMLFLALILLAGVVDSSLRMKLGESGILSIGNEYLFGGDSTTASVGHATTSWGFSAYGFCTLGIGAPW